MALWYLPQMRNINILVITGNPLGLAGQAAYAQLESALQNALSAVIINDQTQGDMTFIKKVPGQRSLSNFPYPNPIKLMSREN